MDLLRVCTLMEQIDALHMLKERLSDDLGYRPKMNVYNKTLREKHKKLIESGIDEYMLNWTKMFSSTEAILEYRHNMRQSTTSASYSEARIHVTDGPECIRLHVTDSLYRMSRTYTYNTHFSRFSWAALPYWMEMALRRCDNLGKPRLYKPIYLLSDIQPLVFDIHSCDEDPELIISATADEELPVGPILNRISSDIPRDAKSYHIIKYGSTEGGFLGDYLDIHTEMPDEKYSISAKERWLKRMHSYLCSKQLSLITVQAISDEKHTVNEVTAHFITNKPDTDLMSL